VTVESQEDMATGHWIDGMVGAVGSVAGVRGPMYRTPHPSALQRRTRLSVLPTRLLLRIVVVAALLAAHAALACSSGTSSGPKGITIPAPTHAKPAQWELQWSDEFAGPALDATTWIAVEGPAEVNDELQYYTPEDVYIENGSLVLRTRQRPMGGRGYTSGEVRTGQKRMVTRGFAVEWRTKVPKGRGIWPANWLVHNACTGLVGCGRAQGQPADDEHHDALVGQLAESPITNDDVGRT
jgi:beta-glucanase (GH16 family)